MGEVDSSAGLRATSLKGAAFEVALNTAHRLAREAWKEATGSLFSELRIEDYPLYDWTRVWLSRHPELKRNVRKRIAMAGGGSNAGPACSSDEAAHNARKTTLQILPGSTEAFFWHNRYPVWVVSSEGEYQSVGLDRYVMRGKGITFTTLRRYRGVLIDLIQDIARGAVSGKNTISLYLFDGYGGWQSSHSWPPRRFDSVVLDDGIAESLREDLLGFLKDRQWYLKMGIPYRRGYLLHGEPGNGKTSFVTAVAGELGANIYSIALNSKEINDEKLTRAMMMVPRGSVVLLEDVDVAFNGRKRSDEEGKVTFSGLLNALDGVLPSDGRIVFMTTNHLSSLDPALRRPGRVDKMVYIGNASKDQLYRMFLRFYPQQIGLAHRFAESVPAGSVSMAAIQEYLLIRRGDPKRAVRETKQLGRVKT